MKSLVQIKQQGKVKGLSASAAVSGLPVEEIETRGALLGHYYAVLPTCLV
jgi:hypothetical protein